MTFFIKTRVIAAFNFLLAVPARRVVRTRLEVAGLATGRCWSLMYAFAVDGDEYKGWFVEFAAIGTFNLQLVPVWTLNGGVGMASKREIC